MRIVTIRFPNYEQSPSGLEMLIMNLKYDQGVTGAAKTLGISRSTVSYWLRKLMLFRQFAGQPPEAILTMLSDVVRETSVSEAAKLIEMNPKTLQRALNEFNQQTAAQAA